MSTIYTNFKMLDSAALYNSIAICQKDRPLLNRTTMGEGGIS